MVKGISRRVIVVRSPDQRLFEQAIFLLKEDALEQQGVTAQQVVQEVADKGLAEDVALVLGDRVATHEHYDAYEGPFEDVGTTVNNTYLRSFGEDAGVRSYGLVVDYLIAWNQSQS